MEHGGGTPPAAGGQQMPIMAPPNGQHFGPVMQPPTASTQTAPVGQQLPLTAPPNGQQYSAVNMPGPPTGQHYAPVLQRPTANTLQAPGNQQMPVGAPPAMPQPSPGLPPAPSGQQMHHTPHNSLAPNGHHYRPVPQGQGGVAPPAPANAQMPISGPPAGQHLGPALHQQAPGLPPAASSQPMSYAPPPNGQQYGPGPPGPHGIDGSAAFGYGRGCPAAPTQQMMPPSYPYQHAPLMQQSEYMNRSSCQFVDVGTPGPLMITPQSYDYGHMRQDVSAPIVSSQHDMHAMNPSNMGMPPYHMGPGAYPGPPAGYGPPLQHDPSMLVPYQHWGHEAHLKANPPMGDVMHARAPPHSDYAQLDDGESATRTDKARRQIWSPAEDQALAAAVARYGCRRWSHIAMMVPGRVGKQCRERWINHLRPGLKHQTGPTRDHWTEEEERIIMESVNELGPRWSEIAKRLPGRTDNAVKNHYNSGLRKRKRQEEEQEHASDA